MSGTVLPRLIWTSHPDSLETNEISIEIKLRCEYTVILLREAAKRGLRPVDVVADILENVLLACDLPNADDDELFMEKIEKIWG